MTSTDGTPLPDASTRTWMRVLGGLALVIAAVWLFAWPADVLARSTSWWANFLLRWGHAAAWFLIGGACLLSSSRRAWAKRIGRASFGAAGLTYVAFVTSILGTP